SNQGVRPFKQVGQGANPPISQRRRRLPMPLKMLAACGSRACRLPRRKFTRRCTERSDFVDRKQRIKPQRAQRSQAATEFRIISRKDAKAAKRKKYLSELSVLGAL